MDRSTGSMATGWRQIKGVWYWFDGGGVMVTGTRTIGGKQQVCSNSGAWQK